MKRWILVLSLPLLSGCDVATVALILGTQDSGSSDDDPLPANPNPGFVVYQAWTAFIPDSAAADAERQTLIQNHGNPNVETPTTPTWTFIGPIANSTLFDPSAVPTSINAILIQVSSAQNFELDSVEVLDDQDNLLEHASGATWWNLVTNANNILGPPDGVTALTAAAGIDRAFIFTLFPGSAGIPRFRINGHGDTLPPNPGDVVAVGGGTESFGVERPGGLAIRGDGLIHVTLSIDDTGRLSRYNLAGVRQDFVSISTDLAAAGSHSVALNSNGDVFTSCSVGSGLIQVRKFDPIDLTPGNNAAFASGFNGDRVEHNSIAVDSDGDIVVVGGFSSLLSGRNHFRAKMIDTLPGTTLWQSSSSLDSSSTTYWHAVTAGANGEVLATGDLNTILFGGTVQIYSSRFDDGGTPTWVHEFPEGDVPSDVGHAIAQDSAGNVYVAGSVGTDTEGLDGVLLRYAGGAGTPAEAEYIGDTGLDAEFLDVAVDSDGAIYVVGYEVVTGQGENWWVRKYVYDTIDDEFDVVWTRTHHGGFGADRAISCAIHNNNLVVAGYETNGTGQTKFVLRVYEK